MLSFSHPTGNRNVRAVLSSFDKAGMLAEFQTTISTNPDALWLRLLPHHLRQELLRRSFPIPSDKIRTSPLLEFLRMALPKLGVKKPVEHEVGWASIDSVYRQVDKLSAHNLERLTKHHNMSAVYAYEDCALHTFKRAKSMGLTCIYDLPIAYWETIRKLMREEAERLPDWVVTLGGGIKDTAKKLDHKTQELELADVIIGPGQFVKDSLPAWAMNKKVIISPFGSPELTMQSSGIGLPVKMYGKQPLRVLFAGSMGQRKGLADLFEAVRMLNTPEIELVVMGSLLAPLEFYKTKLPRLIYEEGRLHEEVLALMRTCDVFCLPSIVEGRALVMQEAMSQGLPLIITPNSGGADLIKEAQTGFLVPIRAPEIIAEKLSWFLEHRRELPEMGKLAQEHAALYTWENYGKNIIKELTDFLDVKDSQNSNQSRFS